MRRQILPLLAALLVGGVLYAQTTVKADQGRPGTQGPWPVNVVNGITVNIDGGVNIGAVVQGASRDGGTDWAVLAKQNGAWFITFDGGALGSVTVSGDVDVHWDGGYLGSIYMLGGQVGLISDGGALGSVVANQGTSPWAVGGTVTANQGGAPWSATVTGNVGLNVDGGALGSVSVTNTVAIGFDGGSVTAYQGTSPWAVSGTITANQGGAPWSVAGQVGLNTDGGYLGSVSLTGATASTVTANQGVATDGGVSWAVQSTGWPADSTGAFGALLNVQEEVVTHLDFSDSYFNPEIVTTTVDGGAYLTADGGRAFLNLVATANGIATMESINTAHYVPGQGMACRFTLAQSACKIGQQTEIGCGTSSDGFFFGCCPSCETDAGTAFGILRRSAGVDNWTPASQWNGAWGTTAPDVTKGRPYQIVYQWLGYGQISYFIENENTGRFQLAHAIKYAGTNTETSVRDPTFPLRAAIRQFADAGTGYLSTPSMGYLRHGPPLEDGPRRGSGNSKAMNSSTQVPVITLKNNTSFNGLPNHHALHLDFISWDTSGNAGSDTNIIIWKNTGLYGTVTFTDFSANSFASINTAASGIDGGGVSTMVMWSAANTSERLDLTPYHLILQPGETYTIAGISAASTPTLRIGISWGDDF